jgi:hypothetical protein
MRSTRSHELVLLSVLGLSCSAEPPGPGPAGPGALELLISFTGAPAEVSTVRPTVTFQGQPVPAAELAGGAPTLALALPARAGRLVITAEGLQADRCLFAEGSLDVSLAGQTALEVPLRARTVLCPFELQKAGKGRVTTAIKELACDGPSCSALVSEGAFLDLQPVPEPGSHFADWSGACGFATGVCRLRMPRTAQKTSANFFLNPVISVRLTGDAQGGVTSMPPGLDCGNAGACAAGFTPGTRLVLTAQPRPGALFEGWGGACSGTGPCEITVLPPREVTASFVVFGSPARPGRTCRDILDKVPGSRDGLYTIEPIAGQKVQVYCDMGRGGWTRVMSAKWKTFFTDANWQDLNGGDPMSANYSILKLRDGFKAGQSYTFRFSVGDEADKDWSTGAVGRATDWRQDHDPFTQTTNGADYVFLGGVQSSTCGGFNGLHNRYQGYSYTSDPDSNDGTGCWWMQVVPKVDYNNKGFLEGYGGVEHYHQWQALWMK